MVKDARPTSLRVLKLALLKTNQTLMEPRKFKNLEKSGPVILRVGLALVFLWFGSSQLFSPTQWTSFLPGFISIVSPVLNIPDFNVPPKTAPCKF